MPVSLDASYPDILFLSLTCIRVGCEPVDRHHGLHAKLEHVSDVVLHVAHTCSHGVTRESCKGNREVGGTLYEAEILSGLHPWLKALRCYHSACCPTALTGLEQLQVFLGVGHIQRLAGLHRGSTSMALERSHSGDHHGALRHQAAGAALDVEELLHADCRHTFERRDGV